MSNTSSNTTADKTNSKADKDTNGKDTKKPKDPKKDPIRVIVGEIGRDSKSGILGRGYSPDNGVTFHVTDTMFGRLYDEADGEAIWHRTSHYVKDEVDSATAEIPKAVSQANSAVSAVDSAISASKVNSDAMKAMSDAVSQAQAAAESAAAEVKDTIANAASDAAAIRKDVSDVENEVKAAKSANADTVKQIRSDVSQANADISAANSRLDQAQSAASAAHTALQSSVAAIQSEVATAQGQIKSAQAANDNLAKQLDTYTQQATAQGKTIKSIEDTQDSLKTTIADVKGNVTQVSDSVTGLQAGLKDTNNNVASVTAKANALDATLTDAKKNIDTLSATATSLQATLGDAQGRLTKIEATASGQSTTISNLQNELSKTSQSATQLTATVADAQKNITALQADAKGTKQQITDLQGDVSTLQSSVKGLQATVADHTGKIDNLSVTVNGLTNDVRDAKGNISSLQQTATSTSSTVATLSRTAMQDRGSVTDSKASFDDLTKLGTYSIKATGLTNMPEQHYGTLVVNGSADSGSLSQQFIAGDTGNVYTRTFSNDKWSAWKQGGSQESINQIKQTADSNKATISSVDGRVTQIKQDLDGVSVTAANAKNDINSLKVRADGFDAKLTTQGNDIATVKASANQLTTRMAGVETTTSNLTSKTNDLTSKTNDLISKAEWQTDAGAVDLNTLTTPCHKFLKGTVTNAPNETAWWYVTVEGSDPTRVTQTAIADQSGNRYTRQLNKAGWSVWVKQATQNDVDTLNDKITANTTEIDQNKRQIALKADQSTVDNLNGELNKTNAQLQIQADRIKNVVSDENLKLLSDKVDNAIASINKNSTAIDETSRELALTAKQVDVDNVKKEADDNAAQLRVQAGQISSKVDSTEFTGLRKAVDLQNLDSANIDDMKANGHYFVKNLTGNPIGGWVYVDVTGNGTDRIRQDVYQDTGNKHMYRRLNGTSWTAWSTDATQADIADVQTTTQSLITQKADTISETITKLDGKVADQIQNITASIDGVQSTVKNKADQSQITQLANAMQIKMSGTTIAQADKVDLKYTGADNEYPPAAPLMNKDIVKKGTKLELSFDYYATGEISFVPQLDGDPWIPWGTIDKNFTRAKQKVKGHFSQTITTTDDSWATGGATHFCLRCDYFVGTITVTNLVLKLADTTHDLQSTFDMLRDDINLRVQGDNLLSQINLTAGNTLIQSNKIYLDASSTVFSGKAFIPSAAIVDLDADKITTGVLHVPM